MTAIVETGTTFGPEDAARWRTLSISVRGGASRVEAVLLDTVRPWLLAAGDTVTAWTLVRPPWTPDVGGPAEVKVQLCCPDPRTVATFRDVLAARLRDDPADTVVERDFRPVIDRFGGRYGMAVCMDYFPVASRTALAVLADRPAREARLRATASLLLATVRALGLDRAGRAGWLRGYADVQATVTGAPRADVERIRARRGIPAWVKEIRPDPEWQRVQAGVWSALTGLHATGRLSLPPHAVHATLVQMTHNQIGLLPADNARLATLLTEVA